MCRGRYRGPLASPEEEPRGERDEEDAEGAARRSPTGSRCAEPEAGEQCRARRRPRRRAATRQSMWPSDQWTARVGTLRHPARPPCSCPAAIAVVRPSITMNMGTRRKPPPLARRPASSPTPKASADDQLGADAALGAAVGVPGRVGQQHRGPRRRRSSTAESTSSICAVDERRRQRAEERAGQRRRRRPGRPPAGRGCRLRRWPRAPTSAAGSMRGERRGHREHAGHADQREHRGGERGPAGAEEAVQASRRRARRRGWPAAPRPHPRTVRIQKSKTCTALMSIGSPYGSPTAAAVPRRRRRGRLHRRGARPSTSPSRPCRSPSASSRRSSARPLLVRSRHGVTLTAAGEALVPPARQALRDVDTAAAAVAAVTGLVAGRLDLVVAPDARRRSRRRPRRAASGAPTRRCRCGWPTRTTPTALAAAVRSGASEVGITDEGPANAGPAGAPAPGAGAARRVAARAATGDRPLPAAAARGHARSCSARRARRCGPSSTPRPREAGRRADVAVETAPARGAHPARARRRGHDLPPRRRWPAPRSGSAPPSSARSPPSAAPIVLVHRPGPLGPAARAFLAVAGARSADPPGPGSDRAA